MGLYFIRPENWFELSLDLMHLVRNGSWFLRLGYLTAAAAWLISTLFHVFVPSEPALAEAPLVVLFAAAHMFAIGFWFTSAGYLARALVSQPPSRTVSTFTMFVLSALPLLTVACLLVLATQRPKV